MMFYDDVGIFKTIEKCFLENFKDEGHANSARKMKLSIVCINNHLKPTPPSELSIVNVQHNNNKK